jgi:colicin import membrane protein
LALNLRETFGRFLDWRQPGGMLSAGGHVVLLVASVYTLNSAKPFQPASEALPVEVVSESAFNEMMKGDKEAKEKTPEPIRRVDRVAETKEDRDPGLEKTNAPTPPVKQEAAKAEETPPPAPEQKLASVVPPQVTPPVRPPELRVTPPVPTPPLPTPPSRPEPEEKAEPDAEILKKLLEQKQAEEKRQEEQRVAAEKRKQEELRQQQIQKAELQKKLDEQKKAEDLKKAEDAKKLAEQKQADEKKKVEAEAKAKEARLKKERETREAEEQKKLNDAIRQRLLASREAPASTGATGAAVQNRASLGTANATGQKLSPSDRAQLIGILTEQMSRCISYSGTAPKQGPQLTFTLARDGAIAGGVQLVNRSGESNFVPFAEATMRALRNCQPYRVPARFLATYDDWKNVRLNIDTSEMQ